MTIFDIPYDPNADQRWTLPVPGDGERAFESRDAAMKFAMEIARKQEDNGDGATYICVEGGDRRWRLFDRDFKSVMEPDGRREH